MASLERWVVAVGDSVEVAEIGAKAARLAVLAKAGFRTPPGISITTAAYEAFVQHHGLNVLVAQELGRKPLDRMRWEELWDAGLRIRHGFLQAPFPSDLSESILKATAGLQGPLAVRSSAPHEDHTQHAFAGVHDSKLGVAGDATILDAIRLVWASLWSDAALLYRRELNLDLDHSRMAVLIQPVLPGAPSGIAFSQDPRGLDIEQMVVEMVDGSCAALMEGRLAPKRYTIPRKQNSIPQSLLDGEASATLVSTVRQLETLLKAPVDVEWTWHDHTLYILQARPATTATKPGPQDKRPWYLSLRVEPERLRQLHVRVAQTLIPELRNVGDTFAAEDLETSDDDFLANALYERRDALAHWQKVYETEFIPFAHGVRQFGLLFNELCKPKDPYAFLELLRGEPLLGTQRNEALQTLASELRQQPTWRRCLEAETTAEWPALCQRLSAEGPDAKAWIYRLIDVVHQHLDVVYGGQRLSDDPRHVVALLVALADHPERHIGLDARHRMEAELFANVAEPDQSKVRDALALARISWRLRDDDNLLLGRLESQLQRARDIAMQRLQARGQLYGASTTRPNVDDLVRLLKEPEERLLLAPDSASRSESDTPPATKARQLVGQPASPGLATGRARIVRNASDLKAFLPGEVLVCDAIQPTMTHIVPLASAIIERRGGMLVHGAIIARELGIPCVNGVVDAVRLIDTDAIVSVDGWLGIVTLGTADLALERHLAPSP